MPIPSLIALAAPLLAGQVAHIEPDPVNPHEGGDMLSMQWSLASTQLSQAPRTEDAPPDHVADEPVGNGDDDKAAGPPETIGAGQIVVEGSYGPPENDPIQQINEESYRITQQLDKAFVEPVAYAYRDGLPDPLRDGLGNVVRNLGEPNNALNFLLQGKFGKTFETLGRMVINSTLGFGGLVDLAKKPGIGLPYRRNGFANTMGFYGVGSGAYLYLPVTGATSARDLVGSGLDQLLLPLAVGAPFDQLEFTIPYFVVNNLDARLELDEELERIGETLNPYAARRDTYLYRRAKTIAELKGAPPPEPPLILDEVEGTGHFTDPPAANPEVSGQHSPGKVGARNDRPTVAVIITRPKREPR